MSFIQTPIRGQIRLSIGSQYLWGYRDLKTMSEELPTKPDEISSSFSAKRLAVFESNGAITVEYVSDDAALEKLGYGLKEKTAGGKKTYEFKVNGIKEKGSFAPKANTTRAQAAAVFMRILENLK